MPDPMWGPQALNSIAQVRRDGFTGSKAVLVGSVAGGCGHQLFLFKDERGGELVLRAGTESVVEGLSRSAGRAVRIEGTVDDEACRLLFASHASAGGGQPVLVVQRYSMTG